MRVEPVVPILSGVLTFSCTDSQVKQGEPLPPLEHRGDRVSLGTSSVEQVCQGTLVDLDEALARVEQELGLPNIDVGVDIYLLEAEALAEHCGAGVYACSVDDSPREIYLRAALLENVIVQELVHDRVAYTPAAGSHPLFAEGLAAAIARPLCPPLQSWKPPSATALLELDETDTLPKHGVYLAGELVRWLLDVHGPDAVLELMAAIRDQHDADAIRASYLDRFGSVLDDDLFAHRRELDEPLPVAQSGCLAPEAPRSPATGHIELEAVLDCSSARVRNDFFAPERVFVEWTLTVSQFGGGRHELLGALPPGTELHIEPCSCLHGDGTLWSQLPKYEIGEVTAIHPPSLEPGVYRLRFLGPIGAELDLDIDPPCDFVAQNCPEGLACAPWGRCYLPPDDPRGLGEPCDMGFEELIGDCDVGLLCVGNLHQDPVNPGVCMAYCGDPSLGFECPDGQSCGSNPSVCANDCDPLAQDCDPEWRCMPDLATGAGGCLPSGDRGLLETCSDLFFDSCGPGLLCRQSSAIEGCNIGFFNGCCTPICDPAAADPGCPPQLPNCAAQEDDVLGVCEA